MGIKAKEAVILALIIAALPAVSLLFAGTGGGAEDPLAAPALNSAANVQQSGTGTDSGIVYTIYDEANGKTFTASEREYTIAAVMSELPSSYEYEAIKAQVVATRTYARYVRELRETQPLAELQGGQFSVNTDTHTGYMTESRGKLFFGSDYGEYRTLVEKAADETAGIVLMYGGEPIAACYHAISPGSTENSENVFSSALPYLVAVESIADTSAEGYKSEKAFSPDELSSLLHQYESDFVASGSPAEWIKGSTQTASGTVTQFAVCNETFTGAEIREALGLRSAAFTASYSEGAFIFVVLGYGHGVGLSQNGANALAKEGGSFVEILSHYYPGAVCVDNTV